MGNSDRVVADIAATRNRTWLIPLKLIMSRFPLPREYVVAARRGVE